MQTTWQRLAPDGVRWAPKFKNGAMDGNLTNLVVMTILLNRAVTLYWENRPEARELSVVNARVAV